MSRKAGLHVEEYKVVTESAERTRSDADNGLNKQQENSEGLKMQGLALPFEKRSRNGVIYEKESVKKAASTLEGCPVLFNHNEDNSIGHITSTEIRDDGLYYEADLNPELREVESLERGDIPHVSIQAMIEETEATDTRGEVAVTEFLEMSAVTIPGFPSTDVETGEETVMIEKLVTEDESENGVSISRDKESSEALIDHNFEFEPVPDQVLYRDKNEALVRAKSLGLESVHKHVVEDREMFMAGKNHQEWRQAMRGELDNEESLTESLENPEFEVGDFVEWEFGEGSSQGEVIDRSTEVGDSMSAGGNKFTIEEGDGPLYKMKEWDETEGEDGEFTNNVVKFEDALNSADRPDAAQENSRSKEPFAGYDDFDDCVRQNSDKDDPEAYCGAIKDKTEMAKGLSEAVDGVDTEPTQEMANVASEVLEKIEDSEFDNDDCGTRVGLERANQLENQEELSADTINRMVSFFARHDGNQKVNDDVDSKWEDCGFVAWQLWGGDAGREWAERKQEEIKDAKNEILGGKTTMTKEEKLKEKITEQLEEVDEDDFTGTVADMYEEVSASDAASLMEDFTFTGSPESLVALVADLADMTPADLMEVLDSDMKATDGDEDEDEQEEGDYSDDEEEEESESSNKNESSENSSQQGENMSSKSKEELADKVQSQQDKIEKLEEAIDELEDVEGSKQDNPVNQESSGLNLREDALEELSRR